MNSANIGSEALVGVRYVGTKDVKYDNVCRTQVVWRGQGDVQLVPIEVAAKLARFPNVWEVVKPAGSAWSLEAPFPTATAVNAAISACEALGKVAASALSAQVPCPSLDPTTDGVEPDAAAAASQRPVLTLPAGRKGRR